MMGSRVAAAMALVASLPACVGLLSMTVEVGGHLALTLDYFYRLYGPWGCIDNPGWHGTELSDG